MATKSRKPLFERLKAGLEEGSAPRGDGRTMAVNDLTDLIRGWLPFTATGPSTLRGYKKGSLKALREHLATLTLRDLRSFAVSDEAVFRERLDYYTIQLEKVLPVRPNWGAARKVLNIYLRNALYNHYIRDSIPLELCESFLEVPLDRLVGTALRRHADGADLPRWKNLSCLNPQSSNQFQAVASIIATRRGLKRVHLDLIIGPDNLKRGISDD